MGDKKRNPKMKEINQGKPLEAFQTLAINDDSGKKLYTPSPADNSVKEAKDWVDYNQK